MRPLWRTFFARRFASRPSAIFLAALDQIEALKLPPMTEEEVQAEINAARAERRARTGK